MRVDDLGLGHGADRIAEAGVPHRGRRHAAGKRERERCGERHAAHDDEVGGFHERPLGWLQRSVDSGAALTRTTCCAWAAAGVRRFGCPPAGPACRNRPPQDVRRRLRYARCGPRWRIRAARRRRQPVPASSAARPAPAAARPSPAARAGSAAAGPAGASDCGAGAWAGVCGAAAAPFAGWAPCLRTPPRPSMLPVAYVDFVRLREAVGRQRHVGGLQRLHQVRRDHEDQLGAVLLERGTAEQRAEHGISPTPGSAFSAPVPLS